MKPTLPDILDRAEFGWPAVLQGKQRHQAGKCLMKMSPLPDRFTVSGKTERVEAIRRLFMMRALVAALGERTTPQWWRTQFLTDVGLRAIGRVFPRTAIRAAIESTSIVARADHDRRIGVGRRYHLFRFPTTLEHGLIEAMLDDSFCAELTGILKTSQNGLLDALAKIASSRRTSATEGAIRLGLPARLVEPSGLEELASHYRSCVETGRRVFPYFESEEH
jgi:hypothetical protein